MKKIINLYISSQIYVIKLYIIIIHNNYMKQQIQSLNQIMAHKYNITLWLLQYL